MSIKIILFLIAIECNQTFGIGLRSLILEAHNRRRAKYGNQPMVLDEDLCTECSEYAEEIVRNDGVYRENYLEYLYATGPVTGKHLQIVCVFRDALPRECVRIWFHYRGFAENTKYYRFTAMIWNASTRLGVGLGRIQETRYLVVRYAPPGNVLGEMASNVPKRPTTFWDSEHISGDHGSESTVRITFARNGVHNIFGNWLSFVTTLLNLYLCGTSRIL
ncbi:Golgi-associated plant pathogenesis-related protein 1 [Drosophila sechellia]|uniref:GM14205 n=1 Tax=Drosophila sechellia TaxID=7238 RepID=B4HVU7_DROSE|nr:Golgi-associated plant pathogenesis-related protein 1 [Drosophila sechellia]EDW50062.1 GM14205 [Drosophila sechellia]